MQGIRYTSFITTSLLLLGAICVHRASPWQATRQTTGAGKRQVTTDAGYYGGDVKQGRYASYNGILALGNPKSYTSVSVRPEIRRAITEIALHLETETFQKMQSALHTWKQHGGYTDGKSPNFLYSAGSPANELMILKSQAEKSAYALLNAEEQESWNSHSHSGLSKLTSVQIMD